MFADDGGDHIGSGSEDSDTYSPVDIYSQDTEEALTNKMTDNKATNKLHQG